MTAVNVVTIHNNFARAQVDHDFDGRFDLPLYSTCLKTCENFITNFKGNAIYRTAFERMLDFEDCGLLEFRFSQNQNYLLALYNTKMRFASYAVDDTFGWVLNGGSTPLEVATPYTLAQSKDITFRKAYTQNFDSIIVTLNGFEPRELKRLSANSFRFNTFSRKDDPFPKTWASTKNISGITQASEAVFTITGHGYALNERFKVAGVTGMTEINGWTAAVIEVVDVDHVRVDIDTTTFTAYAANGTGAKVLTGDYPNVCVYYKSRLWYGASTDKPTTVWASEAGEFKTHTIPTTLLAESAIQLTIAELDSRIESMTRGQNSLIIATNNDVGAINGGTPSEPITAENVEFTLSDADGASQAEPLAKDGFIFYITNDQRNMNYFSYDLLTETFGADNANITAEDITVNGVKKIRYVETREDLIFGLREDGKLLSCNFNAKEKIIGWHIHPSETEVHDIASIADNYGVQQLFLLNEYNGDFYIERQAPYIEFALRKDFRLALDALDDDDAQQERDDAKGYDDEAHYRYIAEQLKSAIYLDNGNILQDLRTTTLTFVPDDPDAVPVVGTITSTGTPFTADSVGHHIVYKTATGYESGRFEITAYNSATSVDVEVLQTPLEIEVVDREIVETPLYVWSSWYMTFSTIPDMDRFDTFDVKVVADGGFLDDFTVDGTEIELEQEVTSVVVGYGYRGVCESFTLGFQIRGDNTQVTEKAINRVTLRLHDTSGGRIGTTLYRLDAVQQLTQEDLNYLPPLPLNGTENIDYSDNHDIDKTFMFVQDVPLPMVVAAAMVECSYAVP